MQAREYRDKRGYLVFVAKRAGWFKQPGWHIWRAKSEDLENIPISPICLTRDEAQRELGKRAKEHKWTEVE